MKTLRTSWRFLFYLFLITAFLYILVLLMAFISLPDVELTFPSGRSLLGAVIGSTVFWMIQGIVLHLCWTEYRKEKRRIKDESS